MCHRCWVWNEGNPWNFWTQPAVNTPIPSMVVLPLKRMVQLFKRNEEKEHDPTIRKNTNLTVSGGNIGRGCLLFVVCD